MSPHSVKLSSWPIWWCWTSLNLSFFCSFALQLQRESDICIFFHIPTEFPWGANPCNPNSGSHWVQFNEFLICAYQKFIFHASGQHKALDQSLEFMSTAKSAHKKPDIWCTRIRSDWQKLEPSFAPNNESKIFHPVLPHVASTMLLHSKVWHC